MKTKSYKFNPEKLAFWKDGPSKLIRSVVPLNDFSPDELESRVNSPFKPDRSIVIIDTVEDYSNVKPLRKAEKNL